MGMSARLDPAETIDGSYGSAERDLICAVVRQSIDDLNCSDYEARHDARQFWTDDTGAWAQSRRDLLALLGLDDAATCDHVRRLVPDEPDDPDRLPRTRREWNENPDLMISKRKRPAEVRADKIEAILPTHGKPFTASDIDLNMTKQQIAQAMRILIERGVVARYARGNRHHAMQYIKTEDLLPLRNAATR